MIFSCCYFCSRWRRYVHFLPFSLFLFFNLNHESCLLAWLMVVGTRQLLSGAWLAAAVLCRRWQTVWDASGIPTWERGHTAAAPPRAAWLDNPTAVPPGTWLGNHSRQLPPQGLGLCSWRTTAAFSGLACAPCCCSLSLLLLLLLLLLWGCRT